VPKPVKYLMAWAVATSIGIGVALLGVRVVLQSTSAERPPLVVAPDAQATQASDLSTPASLAPTPTPTPTSTRSARTGTPTPTTSTPTKAPGGQGPGAVKPAPGAGGRARPDSVRLCEGDDRGLIQSYTMLGGRAAVGFSPGQVCLVSAIPRSGHVVSVEREGGDRLLVRFRSEHHQSELDASWADQPVARSKEIFW
jgi:hypothetical protein